MKIKWYAHLPGVVLESVEAVSLGRGVLAHLPFSQWVQLDKKYPWKEKEYELSQPVFYCVEAIRAEDFEMSNEGVQEDLRNVYALVTEENLHLYKAFLLAPSGPILPPPSMSVSYLINEYDFGRVYNTLVGPFEQEWIVFGNPLQYLFDSAQISAIQRNYDRLERFNLDTAFAGVEAGFETLALTALPEFWWDKRGINRANEFIHCMAALEHILLPALGQAPKGMKLTPTFGRHAAVLLEQARDDLATKAGFYSDLYRLRSRLIHGEVGIEDLSDAENMFLVKGRYWLGRVLLRIMELSKSAADGISLPTLLAKAYQDASYHQLLFKNTQQEDNSDN